MAAVIATGIFAAARTAPAAPLPVPQDAPPATKYALIDLGILGDFTPGGGTNDPNPDKQGTMGINNLGEVVYAYNDICPANPDGILRAFVWLPNHNYGMACGRHDLDTLSGLDPSDTTIARDINDSGQIVGQYRGTNAWQDAQEESQAILWELLTFDGLQIDFTLLPNHLAGEPTPPVGFIEWSGAHAINNDADPLIVGSVSTSRTCVCNEQQEQPGIPIPRMQAFQFRFGVDDPLVGLNELVSTTNGQGEARDVAPSPDAMTEPDVVGRSLCEWEIMPWSQGVDPEVCFGTNCGQDVKGTLWEMLGSGVEEQPQPSPNMIFLESSARGTNDASQNVGYGRLLVNGQCDLRAIYWDPMDTSYPAPTVVLGDEMPDGQDGDESRAEAINNNCMQQVVGWNDDQLRAIRWHRDDDDNWHGHDLSNMIRSCDGRWEIIEAHDVNDHGWIAAWAINLDEQGSPPRAVVLIPVPPVEGDTDGDEAVGLGDQLTVLEEWGNTCNCPYCPGDVDGDGAVGLSDLMTVLSNWGSTLDACAFVPDIDCAPAQSLLGGGGGSTLMSGNSSSSSNEPDFAAVLEEWGFESWDDVAAWMDEASPAEVADFLIALADAVSG